MKITSRFWTLFDRLIEVMAGCGMAVLGLIMLAVVWEVITRYFLGQGTIWVEEMGEYSMLYITFLGAAWLLKNEGHVEMDIVVARFSQKTQLLIKVVTSWVAAAVCLVLTWSGGDVAFDHLQRGLHQPTPVEPPDFPLFGIIPLGFLMLCIQFLRRGHSTLLRLRQASAEGSTRTGIHP